LHSSLPGTEFKDGAKQVNRTSVASRRRRQAIEEFVQKSRESHDLLAEIRSSVDATAALHGCSGAREGTGGIP